MAVTVRFPAMLQQIAGSEVVVVSEAVGNVGELLEVLHARIIGLSGALADPIYNFAVNDEMLLHGVRAHPLRDGDIIEIVPTISGG